MGSSDQDPGRSLGSHMMTPLAGIAASLAMITGFTVPAWMLRPYF